MLQQDSCGCLKLETIANTINNMVKETNPEKKSIFKSVTRISHQREAEAIVGIIQQEHIGLSLVPSNDQYW